LSATKFGIPPCKTGTYKGAGEATRNTAIAARVVDKYNGSSSSEQRCRRAGKIDKTRLARLTKPGVSRGLVKVVIHWASRLLHDASRSGSGASSVAATSSLPCSRAAVARGEYFTGVGSAWVDERRHQLTEVATTARAAAAEAAYAADRYPDAQRLAEAVVAADRLREAM
jgi:hypothetical protein